MKFNSIYKYLSIALLLICMAQTVFAMEQEPKNLIEAVEARDLHAVNHFLSKWGVNVNIPSDWPILCTASENGDVEIVQALLKKGANPDIRDCNNRKPLHHACAKNDKNHISIVKLLIKYKADVNSKGFSGVSPLFVGCEEGSLESVQELVKNGAEINFKNYCEWTPLAIACRHGHSKIVMELLKHNPDINCSPHGVQHPLLTACENGDLNIVQELLKHDACVNIKCANGATPLMAACEKGYDKIVEILVQCNDIDIDCATNDSETALSIAKKRNDTKIITLLSDAIKKQADELQKWDDFKTRINFINKGNPGVIQNPLRFNKGDEQSPKAQLLIQLQSSAVNRELSVLLANSFVLQRGKIVNSQQQNTDIRQDQEKQQKILAKENQSFLNRFLSILSDFSA